VNGDLFWRIEPLRRPAGDLQRGFAAELGDPLWLLGRQWQMGEQQGENASTPLRVEFTVSETPLVAPGDRGHQDPRVIPAEAIIEGSEDDWWTIGRRVSVGVRAVSQGIVPPVDDETDPALLLHDLPEPYRGLSGRVYDGRALARNPAVDLGLIVPALPAAGDHWMSDELAYRTSFSCGDSVLRVDRHDGGDVDWWTVDAARPLTQTATVRNHAALPGRFSYPGAPLPRFWQIEDRHVDIGGFPPDRSHFATLLLIELIASHSDDWFTFPFLTRSGHVLRLHEVTVIDSFGEPWPATGKSWNPVPPDEWAMFRVRNLEPPFQAGASQAPHTLPVWPTAVTPLAGPAVDEIVIGIDEDANLVWAVEQRVNGSETVQPRHAALPQGSTGAPLVYHPTSAIPYHWHPYEIQEVAAGAGQAGRRRFVQARLANLRTDGPSELRPAPRAAMLDVATGIHQIVPSTIPTSGLRLEERFMLARATDGRPVLWIQRQRLPLLGPPSHALRFDVPSPAPRRITTETVSVPQPGVPPPPNDPLVAMVLPGDADDGPPAMPDREPISDPGVAPVFDPAQLPGLAAGDVAPEVMMAQALLNAALAFPADGLPLAVNGQFDTRTGEAATSFQSSRGLAVTGAIDGPTWASLLAFSYGLVLLPTVPAPSGPPIARAQWALNRIGANPVLDVNGVLDDATADALRAFQLSKFLPVTGGLDPATWLALSTANDAMSPTAVLRLTFDFDQDRYEAGGAAISFLSAEVIDQQTPATPAPEAMAAHTSYWMELWDDAATVLYRQTLPDIIPLRVEVYGETAKRFTPSRLSGGFEVIVPKVPRAVTLALYGPPFDVNQFGAASSVIFTLDLTTI